MQAKMPKMLKMLKIPKAAKSAKATGRSRGRGASRRRDSINRVWTYASEPGVPESFRNARARDLATVIHCGDLTSSQISRALRRSQVS
jgi:hypothetical protein